jgi:CHAT domain-containing protein
MDIRMPAYTIHTALPETDYICHGTSMMARLLMLLLALLFAVPAHCLEYNDVIRKGKTKEYLLKYEEDAKQREERGDLKGAAEAYFEASRLARTAGHYQKGVLYGLKAVDLSVKTRDDEVLARALVQTAWSYMLIADFDRAIPLFEKGAALASDQHMRGLEAKAQESLGTIYRKRGDLQQSLAYQQKAFGFYESFLAALEGPSASATRTRKKAVKKFSDTGFVRNFIDVALGIGETHLELNDDVTALAYFEKALFYSTDMKDKVMKTNNSLGDLFYKKGAFGKALELHKKAAGLAESVDIPRLTMVSNARAGRDLLSLRRFDEAVEYYRKALESVESQRSLLQSEEMRSSFFEQMTQAYDGMIVSLMELGKVEEAFNISERVRSRTFLDLLGSRVDLSRGKAVELAAEERELKRRISALQINLEEENNPELKKELEKAEEQYRHFLAALRGKDREHASLLSVDPLTLKDVQALLKAGQTLLEFHILRNRTIAWTVTTKSVHASSIPYGKKELVEIIRSFRTSIEAIASEDRSVHVRRTEDTVAATSYESASQRLYALLLHDSGVREGSPLIIVPHDILHYLPFQALIAPDGKYLLEAHRISYLSSASLLRFTTEKKKKAGEEFLAFGNPDLGDPAYDLAYAESEVKEIAKLYQKADVFIRKDATKIKARELSGGSSILHFATHGEFNEKDPLKSALRLTRTREDDGKLSTGDIFTMNINASLVVLSACETALGKINRGDEVIGFTRAFIYAGAPSIITTLWRVNDRATFMLMQDFYHNLRTMGKADALRAAQLKLMAQYRHPFFWGAFILTGDPE